MQTKFKSEIRKDGSAVFVGDVNGYDNDDVTFQVVAPRLAKLNDKPLFYDNNQGWIPIKGSSSIYVFEDEVNMAIFEGKLWRYIPGVKTKRIHERGKYEEIPVEDYLTDHSFDFVIIGRQGFVRENHQLIRTEFSNSIFGDAFIIMYLKAEKDVYGFKFANGKFEYLGYGYRKLNEDVFVAGSELWQVYKGDLLCIQKDSFTSAWGDHETITAEHTFDDYEQQVHEHTEWNYKRNQEGLFVRVY